MPARHPITRIVRRRYVIGAIAAVAMLVDVRRSWPASASTALLGAVAFAPWVALIGADGGIPLGIAAGFAGSGAVDRGARRSTRSTRRASQIALRFVVLGFLGAVSGVVGDMLRSAEQARRSTVALQRALIDATLDGICLTDDDGQHPHRRTSRCARMSDRARDAARPAPSPSGCSRSRDKLADPERYRKRMLEIADSPGRGDEDEFELAGTGRVFRGFTAPDLRPARHASPGASGRSAR